MGMNYTDVASVAQLANDITAAGTAFSLDNFSGFPSPSFEAVIARGTSAAEQVRVTGVVGSSVTVVRGINGTTASDHFIADPFELVGSGRHFQAAEDHIDASVGVHGTTGTVVGTTDAQTLSNKTYRGAVLHRYSDAEPGSVTAGVKVEGDTILSRDAVHVDSTAAITGKALRVSQSGVDRFTVDPAGNVVAVDVTADDIAAATVDTTGNVTVGGGVTAEGNLSGQHLNIFDITGRNLTLNDLFGGGNLTVATDGQIDGNLTIGGNIISTYLDDQIAFLADTIGAVDTKVLTVNNPPRAEMVRNVAQTIPNNLFTVVTWTGTNVDSHSGWAASPNPTRYTAPVTGRYKVWGGVEFASANGGRRSCRVAQDGTAIGRSTETNAAPTSGAATHAVGSRPVMLQMTAGQYVELQVFQTSGADLDTTANNTSFNVLLIRNDSIT